MFSFLYSVGNKIQEIFQGLGYFDRNEISDVNAKYIPGLEIQFSQQRLREYYYNHSLKSTCFNNEVGILYKLKYGEIDASMMWKPNPFAHFTCILRLYYSDFYALHLNSTCIVDIHRKKLDEYNVGFNGIVGNVSAQVKLYADNFVFSTRHRIHPRFVSLSEGKFPYVMDWSGRRPTLAMGFEFELSSKTILQVMVSDKSSPSFVLQYQFSDPQCLLRFSRDIHSRKVGASFAFDPSIF